MSTAAPRRLEPQLRKYSAARLFRWRRASWLRPPPSSLGHTVRWQAADRANSSPRTCATSQAVEHILWWVVGP
jgi:hypothetical protein